MIPFLFALNIVLGIAVAALTPIGDTTLPELVGPLSGFLVGFAAVFFALWAVFSVIGVRSGYFRRVPYSIRLAGYFIYELVVSSVQVAWDVLTPQDLNRPAFVEMPLDVRSDEQILLVANLISLTPGTLSIDVTADSKTLIVHAMFADDPEALVAQLKSGMERRVRDVFEEV